MRSYKLRGAYNLMVQLDDAERAAGVVAASAGNHAQGVAFACKAMRVPGRIYVPRNTPKQKRDRIRVHGGEFVELRGGVDRLESALAVADGVTEVDDGHERREHHDRRGKYVSNPLSGICTGGGLEAAWRIESKAEQETGRNRGAVQEDVAQFADAIGDEPLEPFVDRTDDQR